MLQTDAQGVIQAGYARVTSVEGVGGSAVFSRIDLPSGILETESGVPASQPANNFPSLSIPPVMPKPVWLLPIRRPVRLAAHPSWWS